MIGNYIATSGYYCAASPGDLLWLPEFKDYEFSRAVRLLCAILVNRELRWKVKPLILTPLFKNNGLKYAIA